MRSSNLIKVTVKNETFNEKWERHTTEVWKLVSRSKITLITEFLFVQRRWWQKQIYFMQFFWCRWEIQFIRQIHPDWKIVRRKLRQEFSLKGEFWAASNRVLTEWYKSDTIQQWVKKIKSRTANPCSPNFPNLQFNILNNSPEFCVLGGDDTFPSKIHLSTKRQADFFLKVLNYIMKCNDISISRSEISQKL